MLPHPRQAQHKLEGTNTYTYSQTNRPAHKVETAAHANSNHLIVNPEILSASLIEQPPLPTAPIRLALN